MTGERAKGVLRSRDGKGVVRIEDRLEAGLHELWSALTEPARLGAWLGEIEGDLRVGGELRARFFASGWSGTGRIEACEPPRRLLVLTKQADEESYDHAIEATLTPDGDGTTIVWEERGMPVDLLAAYGAGIQVHVEDLAAYVAGRGRCDAEARFKELFPSYEALAPSVD